MTDEEKRTALRSMIGGSDTDLVLSTYLNLAARKIIAKAFPYTANDVTAVPARYEYLQLEIAAYMLNKRGAEGQVTHTENGVQRQYENADIPSSMLREIVPYCGVIG